MQGTSPQQAHDGPLHELSDVDPSSSSEEHSPEGAEEEETGSDCEEQEEDQGEELSPCTRFRRVARPNQYRDHIGLGAHKIVYKAIDLENACEVAWNVISTVFMQKCMQLLTSAEKKKVFDEISILQKLCHPNIISLKHFWEDHSKSQIVLITDLFTGGTLSQ